MIRLGACVSWFRRGDAVYAYRDNTGQLTEMSVDLKEFADFFAQPRSVDQAIAAFADQFPAAQINQFVGVFQDQGVLFADDVDEQADLRNGYPFRALWTVAYTDQAGLTLAVVSRGFGTEGYAHPRELRMNAWESALWAQINGETNVERIASELADQFDELLAQAVEKVTQTLAAWTHHDTQLTRILPKPRSQFRQLPPFAASTMPYAPFEDRTQTPEIARDLRDYHQQQITDAETQFDEQETTLSHLLSDPHIALGQRTYAQKVLEYALARGWLSSSHADVIEIGGGTGRFAESLVGTLLAEQPAIATNLRYTLFDLSPVLHAAQRRRLADLPQIQAVLSAAENIDIAPHSVDLAISNEVIADLRIGFVDRDSPHDGDPQAVAFLSKYPLSLDLAPEKVPIQTGAIALLEHLASWLKPGGIAVLTEFGEIDQWPIESTHLDHPEYSVHFGHLMQVAAALGLKTQLLPVPELIELDGSQLVLASTRTQFRNLRHLLAIFGAEMPKRALTPQQFADICRMHLDPKRIHGLVWQPIGVRVMGIIPREFKALIVQRPSESSWYEDL